MKLCGLIPNFYIHILVTVSDLNIPTIVSRQTFMSTSKSKLINNGFHGVQVVYSKQYISKSVKPCIMAQRKTFFLEVAFTVLYRVYRARIFKCLWGPGIDSKKLIPPAYSSSLPSPHRLFKNSSSVYAVQPRVKEIIPPITEYTQSGNYRWYFISTLYELCISNAPQSQIIVLRQAWIFLWIT